ncbi:tRNA-binding protein [Gammaproteobacteria bacterium]|nr:tRNA-binding protein [Gammaproteobacteria bacterium]
MTDITPLSGDLSDIDAFNQIELRVGTVTRAEPFPEARKPAWKLWIDCGPCGEFKSSAQLTALYTPEALVGKQVLCVLNFPTRQIGPFRSECLVTGFVEPDGVVLAVPDQLVRNGSRLA